MRALVQFAKLSRLRSSFRIWTCSGLCRWRCGARSLPVAYSQGFNPHPVMAFASALAVGWTSDCEILDVKLSQPVSEGFAFSQMAAALPPDLPLKRVRLVEDSHPAMMAALRMAEYRIGLDGTGRPDGDGHRAATWRPSVIALRKTKSGEKPADIRAMTMRARPWKMTEALSGDTRTDPEYRSCVSNNTSVCVDAANPVWGQIGTSCSGRR